MTLGFSCRLTRTMLFSTLDYSKKCFTVFSLIKVNIYFYVELVHTQFGLVENASTDERRFIRSGSSVVCFYQA